MWSPGIGTVLHWQSPDVHIFQTEPLLIMILTFTTERISHMTSKITLCTVSGWLVGRCIQESGTGV